MFGPTPIDIVSAEIQKSEIVMSELSERAASGSIPTVANAEAEATKLNQGALEFMLGAQKMMFEEWVFLGDEMLERTRTEMHLFTEFVAKMRPRIPSGMLRRCARNAASISSTSSAAIPNGC
jgi:hypothetical protein